ncbi:MAG TPA: rRNA maturation RNase YbeY [Opitutus sp.]|nr:rRNA maturation RNase YbeY [Opitutus sp.]
MPLRPVSIASRHPRLRLDRRALVRAIHALDAAAPSFVIRHSSLDQAPAGELSLVFLADPALAQLHADFLDDPSVTDVITFAGDPALGTAGEICVSVDAALRHLQHPPSLNSQPSTLSSFSSELTLYVVHGWLHLAGYDDLVPAKKRAMRRAEARALRLLGAARALPRFTLAR